MDDATEALAVGALLMGLFGGLALFLFGMEQMTDALKGVAGGGMKTALQKLTRNRVLGAITGALVTAVIQSSSVTTVLVVGFVSAGVMTLTQSIGVIMGANVGTTITAQIIAFEVSEYALLMIAVGFFVPFAVRRERARLWGAMLMGLGLIFFGMGLMSDSTAPLRSWRPFIDLMAELDALWLGVLAGAAFTALVQSSSATTGIVIVLAGQGFITLEAGIALALGANIGTCVTAMLATIGATRVARRAGLVHVLFNVAGVLIALPLVGQLAEFVREISPVAGELSGAARLAAETPRQVANAHTVFNVGATLVLVPFAGVFGWLVRKLLPDVPEPEAELATPVHLDDQLIETHALAFDAARRELARLAGATTDLVSRLPDAFDERPAGEVTASIRRDAAHLGRLHARIAAYLGRISADDLTEAEAAALTDLLEIGLSYDSAIDLVSNNALAAADEARASGLEPSEGTRAVVREMYELVHAAFADATGALDEEDAERAADVAARKSRVHDKGNELRDRLMVRLHADAPNRPETYRLEAGVVELLERLYFFARRAARAQTQGARSRRRQPSSPS